MQTPVEINPDLSELALLEPGESACETILENGRAQMVVICEHASHHIPVYFDGLGLSSDARHSHAAWDPGAKDLALALSKAFDAPLVCSKVSRLVYDCNRPAGAPSAMPARSEIFDVPGNMDVSAGEAQARYEQIYLPFERMVSHVAGAKDHPVIVTSHSFTPVYHGAKRKVEIGLLYDDDSRLADAMMAFAPRFDDFVIERNEPYGPSDGVAHTIDVHGRDRGLLNVMIEVRNDLLAEPIMAARVANVLAQMLRLALESLDFPVSEGA